MRIPLRLRFATLLAGAVLSACSGSIPDTGSNVRAASVRTAEVRLTVKVPRRRRHWRAGRFVSPSTQSIALTLVPKNGATPVTLKRNVTATADGCSTRSGSTVCTLTFSLKPGKYTASVDTFDGTNETGRLLSYGEMLAVTIHAGKDNTVSLTIGGVPHSLTLSGGSSNITGDENAGFTLTGSAPEPLIITARDADGNLIVGAGTPYEGHVVGGSGWTISASPNPAAPNSLQISPPASPSSAILRVTVNYDTTTCALAGVVCSVTFAAKSATHQYMFVSDCNSACGGSSPDAVYLYAPPFTGSAVAKITNGVAHPTALALDSLGNLYVANCVNCPSSGSSNTVTVYTPPFTDTSSPTKTLSTGLTHPVQLAFNSKGDLFVWNCEHSCGTGSGDSIVRYAGPIENGASPATTVTNGLDTVYQIAIGAGDTLLVPTCNSSCNGGDSNADALLVFASNDYGGTPVSITTGISHPQPIGVDPNGNAFVGNCLSCSTPGYSYSVTEYAAPYSSGSAPKATVTNGVSSPSAILADSLGTLFVGNTGGGNPDVTAYASPFTGAPSTYFSGQGDAPYLMAFDSENDLAIVNYIAVYLSSPPYSSLTPVATGLHAPDAIVFSR